MNLVIVRANEEIAENGTIHAAIESVKDQIANPVNRAHKAFMVRVLHVLNDMLAGMK